MGRLFGIYVPWSHSHELLELKKGKSPVDVVSGVSRLGGHRQNSMQRKRALLQRRINNPGL